MADYINLVEGELKDLFLLNLPSEKKYKNQKDQFLKKNSYIKNILKDGEEVLYANTNPSPDLYIFIFINIFILLGMGEYPIIYRVLFLIIINSLFFYAYTEKKQYICFTKERILMCKRHKYLYTYYYNEFTKLFLEIRTPRQPLPFVKPKSRAFFTFSGQNNNLKIRFNKNEKIIEEKLNELFFSRDSFAMEEPSFYKKLIGYNENEKSIIKIFFQSIILYFIPIIFGCVLYVLYNTPSYHFLIAYLLFIFLILNIIFKLIYTLFKKEKNRVKIKNLK